MNKNAIYTTIAALALTAVASQADTYEIGSRGNISDYPFNGC